jgi:hypothetical protein
MAVRLSALCSGRPLAPQRFLVLISVRGLVNPGAIVRLEGLGKSKKIHLIGSQSRDLPACSIVPQPTNYFSLYEINGIHSIYYGNITMETRGHWRFTCASSFSNTSSYYAEWISNEVSLILDTNRPKWKPDAMLHSAQDLEQYRRR